MSSHYSKDWSTTYNLQYRDRRRFLTPHPGFVDASTASRTQGYYGVKPALSEHAARNAEYQARSLTAPHSLVAPYGKTDSIDDAYSANYSSLSAAATGPLSAVPSLPPVLSGRHSTTSSAAFPSTLNYSHWAHRDLWNASLRPHTGIYSDLTTLRGGVYPTPAGGEFSHPYHAVADAYISTTNGSNFPQNLRGGPSAVAPGVWEYDGAFQSTSGWNGQKNGKVEHGKERYHIPGYQGFVRGIQFQHGDSFGKSTKVCLDVPTDVPLEP